MFWDALLLQAGYNTNIVLIGALLLGAACGLAGSFLVLRKRALVSDAVAHSTLPGIGLAFIIMVALGGSGRNLAGLMAGAAGSAMLGLWVIGWLTRRGKVSEDAAIGAVLSSFFGFGVVILTIIQSMGQGQQAGLEGFLLGATAGMLRDEAIMLAISAGVIFFAVILLRRPFSLAAFDPAYCEAAGWRLGRVDMALMILVLAITVIGLKIVGLVLVIALLIVPPVSARFWTESSQSLVALSALIGALTAYLGAAFSASVPNLPTGPIIVILGFGIFMLSLLISPKRGALAAFMTHLRYQDRVHLRQGLLALAQGQPIYEARTLRLLRRRGLVRADGVSTDTGEAAAAKALLDETRWTLLRADQSFGVIAAHHDGLTALDTVLTADQLAELDRRIDNPRAVE